MVFSNKKPVTYQDGSGSVNSAAVAPAMGAPGCGFSKILFPVGMTESRILQFHRADSRHSRSFLDGDEVYLVPLLT